MGLFTLRAGELSERLAFVSFDVRVRLWQIGGIFDRGLLVDVEQGREVII